MKIVIKTGGVILILGIVVVLGGLILWSKRQHPSNGNAVASSPLTISSGSTTASTPIGDTLLKNGGFEGAFKPTLHDAKDKAKISGTIPTDWLENSNWAPITAIYAPETAGVHGGKTALKITLKTVPTGQLQFVQQVHVSSGVKLHGAIWLRADRPLQVTDAEFNLRAASDPNALYGHTPTPLTTHWQRFEVAGTVGKLEDVYLMVILRKPGATIYVDDAELIAEK